MSAANTGRGGWEPGWTVERVDGDEVVVASSRLRMRVAVADCDGRVARAAPSACACRRSFPRLSPGYWTVLGDAPGRRRPSASVRVYWNVTRGGAPALVGALTSRLNEAGVPFRLKVADHPFRLERCDAAVLYLDGDVFRAVRPELAEVGAELTAHLRPEIPAFTLELAPGVGLAEDDDGGELRRPPLRAARRRDRARARAGARRRSTSASTRSSPASPRTGVDIDAPYSSRRGRHVL